MSDFLDFLLSLVCFLGFIAVTAFFKRKEIAKSLSQKHTSSDDGHVIRSEDDPTCAKYGHDHKSGRRYIVHEEPNEGYVILNGVKHKLKDCADL